MGAFALAASALMPLPTATLAAQGVEAGAELRDAVRRLANDPKSVDALLEAGDAALAMDDADAAAGFYLRADAADPQNGRVKVALARARLRQEDPVTAIALFKEAVSLGQPESGFAADKGLAYDLVGDTRSAQQAYELARRSDSSDALTLRLAVSYDLSGKRDEAAKLLNPLLRTNDSGAWRAQAFLNAAHGELDRARNAARSFLGVDRASQIDQYLTRMDDLSLAQQMAAIHFGHFPRSNYGVDSPAIVAMQRQLGASSPAPAGKSGGKARDPSFIDFRGSKQRGVSYTPTRSVAAPAAPSAPIPAPPQRPTDPGAALAEAARNAAAPPVFAQPSTIAQSAPVAQPAPITQPAPVATAPVAAQPQPAAAPAFTPASSAEPVVATMASPQPSPDQPRDLAALVSGIAIPESERRQDVVPVTADMVELAENPSRNWVQIATGADLNALGFDYRKFSRQNDALFEGKKGWTSQWGATRRLVVGPFDSLTGAKEWNQTFREAGGDSFIWQSDDGTVVDPLPSR